MLTKAELKTLLYLIDRAADELSNNGCNDLRLLADCKLTREEAHSIRELEHAYLDDKERDAPVREDAQKEVYATDWTVLRALAEKLKALHDGAP
jgi:hypothetical protein